MPAFFFRLFYFNFFLSLVLSTRCIYIYYNLFTFLLFKNCFHKKNMYTSLKILRYLIKIKYIYIFFSTILIISKKIIEFNQILFSCFKYL